MAGRTSITDVQSTTSTSIVASLSTATTTVSAIKDVSTASGRPSRRDQLNTKIPNTSNTTSTANNIVSRSYAGSPTGQYPPLNATTGGQNVPQSISTSAFTVGTSRYNR